LSFMKKFLLILMACIVLCGCSSEEANESAFINPGLYEIEFTLMHEAQQIIVKQRVRYNSDGSYTAITYNNDIPIEELKGRYKVESGRLESYEKLRRLIGSDGTWTAWQEMPPSRVEVRNIKKERFQYYFEAPSEEIRKQYEKLGVSEGWKTYERMSG